MLVERLTIANAAPHEGRPLRHHGLRIRLFRQQPPERGMVPTQFVTGRVAMSPNALPQSFDLGDEVLAGELIEVFIHIVCRFVDRSHIRKGTAFF